MTSATHSKPDRQAQDRVCYYICPLKDKERADRVQHNLINEVMAAFGVRVLRADGDYANPNIIHSIFTQIEDSWLVIADITDANPNVFLELGLRLANPENQRRFILLRGGRDGVGPENLLPFDIRHLRYIGYQESDDGYAAAREELRDQVAVHYHGAQSQLGPIYLTKSGSKTIRVTLLQGGTGVLSWTNFGLGIESLITQARSRSVWFHAVVGANETGSVMANYFSQLSQRRVGHVFMGDSERIEAKRDAERFLLPKLHRSADARSGKGERPWRDTQEMRRILIVDSELKTGTGQRTVATTLLHALQEEFGVPSGRSGRNPATARQRTTPLFGVHLAVLAAQLPRAHNRHRGIVDVFEDLEASAFLKEWSQPDGGGLGSRLQGVFLAYAFEHAAGFEPPLAVR